MQISCSRIVWHFIKKIKFDADKSHLKPDRWNGYNYVCLIEYFNKISLPKNYNRMLQNSCQQIQYSRMKLGKIFH